MRNTARTWFLIFATASLAALSCAGQETPQSSIPSFEGWDNKDLYEYGTSLLKKGRSLNRAIAALDKLVKREPSNPEYTSALGCAYASRFASVSLASQQSLKYPEEQKIYDENKEDWDRAQLDQSNPRYKKPEPTPPVLPATPDDNVRFALSAEDSRRELLRLGRLVVNCFDASCKAAEKEAPSRKLQSLYTKGWSLFLLRRLGKGIVSDQNVRTAEEAKSKSEDSPLIVNEQHIADCFKRCTESDAENADFWVSLALATVPKYVDFETEGYGPYLHGQPLYEDERISASLEALNKALKIKRNDFGILYLMSVICAPSRLEDSIQFLQRAAAAQSGNSVVWYQLAERRFRQMDKSMGEESDRHRDEALQAIEAGNAAQRYAAITLALPAPPLLRKAWDSVGVFGIGDDHLCVNGLSNLRDFLRGDRPATPELLTRIAYAEFGFGLKIMQGMAGEDLDVSNPRTAVTLRIRRNFGPVICVDGYKEIEKLNRAHPDSDMARFLKENSEMVQRIREMDLAAYH